MYAKTLKSSTIVKTISGVEIERKHCVRIREQFHQKEFDCFRIDGKWISKHFNNIVLDDYTKEYNFVTKLQKTVSNVVWNAWNNCYDITYAYTSNSSNKSINIYGFNKPLLILNDDYYNELEQRLKKCKISDIYFLDGRSNFKNVITYDENRDNYDNIICLTKAKSRKYSIKDILKYGINSKSFKITEGLKYTFGVELETSDGILTKNQVYSLDLNVKTEKDGSVIRDDGKKYGGAEYITGVLKGDCGFRQLKELCKNLSDKTLTNNTCSVHVHLGNIDFDKSFFLHMIILAKHIEEEIFSTVSRNRFVKSNGEINDFCKKLPNFKFKPLANLNKEQYDLTFDENFNLFFNWLSSGNEESKKCNRLTNHPKGSKCGYDKSSARYSWLNLVPSYFNTRGNKSYTIEFRLMGETTSYNKTKNWILLCMALVNFVENHKTFIINKQIIINNEKLPLNISNILKLVYPKQHEQLINYYNRRKDFFRRNESLSENSFSVVDMYNENLTTLEEVMNENICA